MKARIWIWALGMIWLSVGKTWCECDSKGRQQNHSVIDVAFCLDTTGSMSDLIEEAKRNIWSIVNTVATANPKPELRIGFVAYRDLGDSYVTRIFDFTSDLETMYTNLLSFHADEGDDTPEHVNRALFDAVKKLSWTVHPNGWKLLFLVGDAPPHMDYRDGFDYRNIVPEAVRSGIIVNTVQCGSDADTRRIWQEIALVGRGAFAAIEQNGGMRITASPYDQDLTELSNEINGTYVPYGDSGRSEHAAQTANDRDAATRSAGAAADRAAAKAGSLYGNQHWDLVDASASSSFQLPSVSADKLPPELRGLSAAQMQEYLQDKARFRTALKNRINELSKKREEFLEEENKKAPRSFEEQVKQMLHEQGKRNCITFD